MITLSFDRVIVFISVPDFLIKGIFINILGVDMWLRVLGLQQVRKSRL